MSNKKVNQYGGLQTFWTGSTPVTRTKPANPRPAWDCGFFLVLRGFAGVLSLISEYRWWDVGIGFQTQICRGSVTWRNEFDRFSWHRHRKMLYCMHDIHLIIFSNYTILIDTTNKQNQKRHYEKTTVWRMRKFGLCKKRRIIWMPVLRAEIFPGGNI